MKNEYQVCLIIAVFFGLFLVSFVNIERVHTCKCRKEITDDRIVHLLDSSDSDSQESTIDIII
jgi:hypothetical protein